jgi:hypothetical protein
MTALTNSWHSLVGWTTCLNVTEIFFSYLDCATQIEIFLSRLFRCHRRNCPWLHEGKSLSEAIVTRNTKLVNQLSLFKQAKVLLTLEEAKFTETQIQKFFEAGIRTQTPSVPNWDFVDAWIAYWKIDTPRCVKSHLYEIQCIRQGQPPTDDETGLFWVDVALDWGKLALSRCTADQKRVAGMVALADPKGSHPRLWELYTQDPESLYYTARLYADRRTVETQCFG